MVRLIRESRDDLNDLHFRLLPSFHSAPPLVPYSRPPGERAERVVVPELLVHEGGDFRMPPPAGQRPGEQLDADPRVEDRRAAEVIFGEVARFIWPPPKKFSR